jgi:hypothetical protein
MRPLALRIDPRTHASRGTISATRSRQRAAPLRASCCVAPGILASSWKSKEPMLRLWIAQAKVSAQIGEQACGARNTRRNCRQRYRPLVVSARLRDTKPRPCSPTNVARQRDPMERGDACFETDIANVGLHFRPAHTPNEGFMQMQVIRLEDGLDWGLYKQVKSLG